MTDFKYHKAMDSAVRRAHMTGTVSNNDFPNVSPQDMLEQASKMMREFQRNQITIIVDRGHVGSIIRHKTFDGDRVEMSWEDAARLHKEWPLKLKCVNSPEQAEFVPCSRIFRETTFIDLPKPPYKE